MCNSNDFHYLDFNGLRDFKDFTDFRYFEGLKTLKVYDLKDFTEVLYLIKHWVRNTKDELENITTSTTPITSKTLESLVTSMTA